jgi:hypothetical protein
MLDNLALASVLAELPHIVVAVSSDHYCEFVFSNCGYRMNVLNAELRETELGHEVIRKKRLEEAEHRFRVVGESVLPIEPICLDYLCLSETHYGDIPSFSARS